MSKIFTAWRLVSFVGVVVFAIASYAVASQCNSADGTIAYITLAIVSYVTALVFVCIWDLNALRQKLDEMSADSKIVEHETDSIDGGYN